MKAVIFHPEASAEFEAAVAYYEQQREGLGQEFSRLAEQAIVRIRQNPWLGAVYKATRFRHLILPRFPYVVFYADLEEALWVIAIAHGKRRPGYWRRRATE